MEITKEMKKSSVIFIVPPYLAVDEILTGEPESWLANCAAPLGILSIAAYIDKNANVDCQLLDLNASIAKRPDDFLNKKWNEFLKEEMLTLKIKLEPDIVGIGAIFNSQLGYLKLISDYCKELWPEVVITAGGGGPSNLSQEVFDLAPNIDGIAVGEAEKAFLNLVISNDRIKFLETGKAWKTRARLKNKEKFSHDYIDKLDEIPFYKYDLMDRSFGVTRKIDGSSYKDYKKEKLGDKLRHKGHFSNRKLSYVKEGTVAASMMSSRGCPFFCNFCSSHTMHGRTMRYHTVERVIDDARHLRDEFGVNTLLFEDDLFFADRQKSIDIVNGLAAEGFELDFSGGLSVAHLYSDKVVDALKNAGVRVVKLAVESGNERVLKEIIRKPYRKLSTVIKVVEKLRAADIFIRAFWVIGNPGETKEEILESHEFFKKTGFNWVSIMIAAPIAGSELYNVCKEKDLLISDRIDTFHFGKANIKLPHSSPKEFERFRYLLNLDANFVENYDLKNGHPDKALLGLEDVLSRAPNHAFASYFMAECYRQLNDDANANKYLNKYFENIKTNEKWRQYSEYFGLPIKSFDTIKDSFIPTKTSNSQWAKEFFKTTA